VLRLLGFSEGEEKPEVREKGGKTTGEGQENGTKEEACEGKWEEEGEID